MVKKRLKVLLTGGNGFIGRNLSEAWNGCFSIFKPRSHELNLLDTGAVEDYLRLHMFDVIIHGAKEDVVYNPDSDDYRILDRNLRMFYNLERCSGLYGKLLYLGSGAEYGRKSMPPMVDENYTAYPLPGDPYGFAKYAMRRTAVNSSNIYDICLFGVFGKYEAYQRRFISNNICRSLKGLPMTLRQNAQFDYLYIDDLRGILEWFISNEPAYHCYNVCRGEPVELKYLAGIINEVTGLDQELKVACEGFQQPYTASNKRLIAEIGEYDFTPYKTAVAKLCKYYSHIISTIRISEL